ncbi:hypothetical protein D3C86_1259700 [compost metagenome]
MLGRLVGAVGDVDPRKALARQVLGGKLAHLAGTEDEQGAILQGAETLARQADGGRRDRDGPAGDPRLGSGTLARAQGEAEERVHDGARGALLLRHREGLLELGEDLVLAEDLGLEPRGDPHQVQDRLALLARREARRLAPVPRHEAAQGLEPARGLGSQGVDLRAVAGREDHPLEDLGRRQELR